MRRLVPFALLLSLACSSTAAPTTEPAPSETAPANEAPASAPAEAAPAPAVADAPGADPKLNESWKSEKVDPLVGRLEAEDREIFAHREKITKLVGLEPGQSVADIGAGSGFMTLLFAKAVGKDGKVYAVDINPKLLERIGKQAKMQGLNNVETRVAKQEATPLDPESVDVVFICDTYHHFESPSSTMRSVLAALRPGGELVLVDFERIPGKTSDFTIEHIRAGKEVFRQEILDVGFELVTEHDVPELEQNYVLRFRKPAG